jgi:hypothetical protein
MEKFKTYTQQQVAFAIADCHATLACHAEFQGGYAADHPYVKKIWAEIDALRDRDAVLRKNK